MMTRGLNTSFSKLLALLKSDDKYGKTLDFLYTDPLFMHYEKNNSEPEIEDPSPYALSKNFAVQVTFYFIYFAIFVIAVTGNSLVLYIVSRNSFMQTPTNLFITNLAASDLIMNFLAVPFTPLSSFLESWIFGKAMCHIVPIVQGCAVYVSTLTLTAIALDRYQVMFYPFAPQQRKSTCFLIIVCIWVVSLTLVVPLAVFMELKPGDDGLMHCEENWPIEGLERAYSFCTLVLQYFVPLCVIAYCYVKVSSKIAERIQNRSHTFSSNRKKERDELKRKDRTNRMLIAMVSVFAICWLPLNLIHVLSGLRLKLIYWKYFIILFFVCHVLAMSSTCYNPMIYAWMNEYFRKEFIAVLPCFRDTTNNEPYSALNIKEQSVKDSLKKGVYPDKLRKKTDATKGGSSNKIMLEPNKSHFLGDTVKRLGKGGLKKKQESNYSKDKGTGINCLATEGLSNGEKSNSLHPNNVGKKGINGNTKKLSIIKETFPKSVMGGLDESDNKGGKILPITKQNGDDMSKCLELIHDLKDHENDTVFFNFTATPALLSSTHPKINAGDTANRPTDETLRDGEMLSLLPNGGEGGNNVKKSRTTSKRCLPALPILSPKTTKLIDPSASLAASLRSHSPENSSNNLMSIIKKASFKRNSEHYTPKPNIITVHSNVKYTDFEIV